MPSFFSRELEGTATFWRVLRTDGVALGFTSHDRDLWFDGLLHRAAPGMLPTAIVRTSGLDDDSAEVEGALSHDSISAADLEAGRFDGASIAVGVVDWETLDSETLYRGSIGDIGHEGAQFTASLRSAKHTLDIDPVPRTSPTCRAEFCGPGCTLSLPRFTHDVRVAAVDLAANSVSFTEAPSPAQLLDGTIRWIDGPQAGLSMRIVDTAGAAIIPDIAFDPALSIGTRAVVTEGCDHTLATCAGRFGNAVNFQGEPFLPGNDIIARYGSPAG